jgi:two-component system, OmpR family, response regulator
MYPSRAARGSWPRIRAILRRTRVVEGTDDLPSVIGAGLVKVFPRQRRAECGGRQLDLTSTEFNLLEALAGQAGRPVSKSTLSEQALAGPLARFDRAIDVHMSDSNVRGVGLVLITAMLFGAIAHGLS